MNFHFVRKEGLKDFAVEVFSAKDGEINKLEEVRNDLKKEGIEISKIIYGSRKNIRGDIVQFELDRTILSLEFKKNKR